MGFKVYDNGKLIVNRETVAEKIDHEEQHRAAVALQLPCPICKESR